MKLEELVMKSSLALGVVMSEKQASQFGLQELAVKSSKAIDDLVNQNTTLSRAVSWMKDYEEERAKLLFFLKFAAVLLQDSCPSLLAPNNWDEQRQTLVSQINCLLQETQTKQK